MAFKKLVSRTDHAFAGPSLLGRARALGDRLVVGVNSDDSVRRLKGSGRPYVPEADRAYLLAGLRCVDAVTIFDEDTPLDLIRSLQPDVLVKGDDYRPEDIVGAEVVQAAGGRVCTLPLVEGQSSSDLVGRLRDEM